MLFIVVGAGIGYAVQSVVGQVGGNNALAATVGCVVMALLDLGYRWETNEMWRMSRFVKPKTGGQLAFLPLWIPAAISVVYGTLVISGVVAG